LNPANGQIQIQTQDKEGNHIEATWWIEDTSISPFSTNEPQFIQPGEHQIIIYARGYRTVRQTIMVEPEELQQVTIPLTRTSVNLEDGILILSNSIAFGENSDALRNTHEELLRDVAMTLQSTTHHLLISGHVDPVEFEKNPDLAQQRVDSVQRRLEEYGLDPNRIHSVVVHSEHPIASNHVEDGRSLNRRVELTVLDETPFKESQ
jgi:outer membrane protein OmpA-like peptidoglycan-associated protein